MHNSGGAARWDHCLDPYPKKICALMFKMQIFSFNVCVISNTSVQFFVNISITLRYFPTKVYVFWISIEFFYVYDLIVTSKEVLAGLKMMLTFLSRATSPPPQFLSDKSHTAMFLILLFKKHY